jgi:hypothetical protein
METKNYTVKNLAELISKGTFEESIKMIATDHNLSALKLSSAIKDFLELRGIEEEEEDIEELESVGKVFRIKRLSSDVPNCPIDERQFVNEANEEEVGSYAQFAEYAQAEGYSAIAVTDKISGESYQVKL